MDKKRSYIVDFIKGCCVIGMIIHHSLDYFPLDTILVKRYVRFISGSFLFISGYIVTHFYLTKYNISIDFKIISRRLLIRSLKLIAIFSVLNIAVLLMYPKRAKLDVINLDFLMNYVMNIFISGNYRIAAFELLLPIAYVLFFMGIIYSVFKYRYKILIPITVLMVSFCSVFSFYQERAYNLRFFTIGILGACLGLLNESNISYIIKYKLITVMLFIANLFIITFYRLYFPIYLFNITVTLMLLYLIGASLETKGELSFIDLFGKYTLLSYIAQIMILHIYASFTKNTIFGNTFWGFLCAFFLTFLTILCTDFIRKKQKWFNRLYKIIFM